MLSLSADTVYCFTGCTYDVREIMGKIEESRVLSIVRPGDTVLLKPNWVQEKHDRNDSWEQMITHPVVITAVLSVILDRLEGRGRVIVADSPMTPASFSKILDRMPVAEWEELCARKGVSLEVIDMRNECWKVSRDGIILSKKKLQGDPRGRILFNLHEDNSEFWGKSTSKSGYYGASYDMTETNNAHNGKENLYEMAASVIDADVFVNLPKVKTHKKAGMTCSLKNLVGVSTNKNLLPHHTVGTPDQGGDQFSKSEGSKKLEGGLTQKAKAIANKNRMLSPLLVPLKRIAIKLWGDNGASVRNGSWFGNDTIWRTILDLNKILLYGNKDGTLRDASPKEKKRYVSIADGIIAGQGEGPLAPDPVSLGAIVCGCNPVSVDCAVARLMGLDYERIPSLARCFDIRRYRLIESSYADIACCVDGCRCRMEEVPILQRFKPSSGWKGNVELPSDDVFDSGEPGESHEHL